MAGLVGSDNFLDLEITGHNLDISRIRNYLPEKYKRLVSGYDPSGIITANSKIKGLLNRTSNPHVEISWQFRNGKIVDKNSGITFKNLSSRENFPTDRKRIYNKFCFNRRF